MLNPSGKNTSCVILALPVTHVGGLRGPLSPHYEHNNVGEERQSGLPSVYAHLQCKLCVLCVRLCDPKVCSPPGSSVHGISQARILEWVAISSSRGSSQPRIKPASPVSPVLAGRFFTTQPFPVVMDGCESWTIKLSAKELMLLHCGVGENSWESPGLQGHQSP